MAKSGEFAWAVSRAGSEEALRAALVEWRKRLGSWGAVAGKWRVSRVTMVDWRKRLRIEAGGRDLDWAVVNLEALAGKPPESQNASGGEGSGLSA